MYKRLSHGMQRAQQRGIQYGPKAAPQTVTWPIHVTVPNGKTLRVIELKSRGHADELGFDWVGRDSSY